MESSQENAAKKEAEENTTTKGVESSIAENGVEESAAKQGIEENASEKSVKLPGTGRESVPELTMEEKIAAGWIKVKVDPPTSVGEVLARVAKHALHITLKPAL